MIGGFCTGRSILARTGLLNGYRATIHWECPDPFREAFRRVDGHEGLFAIDRNRITCAGETACLDMMVALTAAEHGGDVAVRISERLACGRIRPAEEGQRLPLAMRLGAEPPYPASRDIDGGKSRGAPGDPEPRTGF